MLVSLCGHRHVCRIVMNGSKLLWYALQLYTWWLWSFHLISWFYMYHHNMDRLVHMVMVMIFKYESIYLWYCVVLIWTDLCRCDNLPWDRFKYEYDYTIYLIYLTCYVTSCLNVWLIAWYGVGNGSPRVNFGVKSPSFGAKGPSFV